MSNFYVHIIESPSPNDLMNRRTEGRLISEGLRLTNIPGLYNLAVNKEKFLESICSQIAGATVRYQKYPILHISAHGDENGLLLTDGTPINWNCLKEILLPFNKGLHGQFVICLSVCRGFSGCKMAMVEGDIPFGAIVGPIADVSWDESAIAFTVFYNRLLKDKNAYKAVVAMNAASGGNNFLTATGPHVQASFIKEYEKIKFQLFQEQLKNLQ